MNEVTAHQWNYNVLSLSLIAPLVYGIIIPDFTHEAGAKAGFAGILLLLVALRSAVASLRKETGKGWVFYTCLTLSSPIWIETGAWLAFK